LNDKVFVEMPIAKREQLAALREVREAGSQMRIVQIPIVLVITAEISQSTSVQSPRADDLLVQVKQGKKARHFN